MKLKQAGQFFLLFLLSCSLGLAALVSMSQAAPAQDKSEAANRELAYSQERPANFVFLLDVSGSMLYPSERVRSADGSMITLFEALRQALKQIVQDERLVSPKSKIAFITFGTAITEKSAWPTTLASATERGQLLSKISQAEELQADKHGDTYMAGGLAAAYKRAQQFAADSAPCTTTFIVMLTDGWDEPPAGAAYRVGDEAARFARKSQELKEKLGVNTWQVRVVGLQRLPDKKTGSTTAVELARMLGGEFIDVSKSQKGTVGERIYEAMKDTLDELRGQIELPSRDSPDGVIDFGRIGEMPVARQSLNVWSKSCYVERLTGVKDCTRELKEAELVGQKKAIEEMAAQGRFPELPEHGAGLLPTRQLPAGAINLRLERAEVLLAPVERDGPHAGEPSKRVNIAAAVGSSCPPGAYLGFLKFEGSARCPGILPYLLTVPSRLTVDTDCVKVQVRKPGFIFDKDTSSELAFRAAAKVNSSNYSSDFDVLIQAGPARLLQATRDNTRAALQLESRLIHNGEALAAKVTSADSPGNLIKLELQIPAATQPGRYEGTISVKCKEHNELVADASVPYQIEVLPSPWDEMSPIAIPVIVLLLLVLALAAFMAVIGSRDRI